MDTCAHCELSDPDIVVHSAEPGSVVEKESDNNGDGRVTIARPGVKEFSVTIRTFQSKSIDLVRTRVQHSTY